MPTDEKPNKRKASRLDLVWLFPILAAIGVGYMLFDTYARRGPQIRVSFESAVGIVGGKTPIRYRGVEIGRVSGVEADPSNDRIMVTGRLDRGAEEFAAEGAQYWIQYPQIGLDGVESLDTLISGPYLAALPGDGTQASEFSGGLERPASAPRGGDLRVVLLAESVESVHRDSPVLFKGIEVGFVDTISYSESASGVSLQLVIHEEYRHLVRTDSYFWEMSGIAMSASLAGGINVDSSSLRSIINGGVSFSNPPDSDGGPASDGDSLRLYSSKREASARFFPISIEFANAEGLVSGASAIKYRGVDVGIVTGMALAEGMQSVVVSAALFDRYRSLATENTLFWIVRPRIDLTGAEGIETITNGSYVSLNAGTGVPRDSFIGLEQKPSRPEFGPGLDVVLRTPSLGRVSVGSPVFYREAVVGRVKAIGLTADGAYVNVHASVEPRYAGLVRRDSRFWKTGGIQIKAGLATFEVEFETLESVLKGGLAFATPPQAADSGPLTDGVVFDLEETSRPEWLEWSPGLRLD